MFSFFLDKSTILPVLNANVLYKGYLDKFNKCKI